VWIIGAHGNVAVTYVMKLSTPAFHFSVACGYKSSTEVMESLMLPMRILPQTVRTLR
jgi:hypothetical protein